MTIAPIADCPVQTSCPVCREGFDLSTASHTVVRALRGERTWAGCPQCRAWFQLGDYDLEQEIEHTRTTPWGQQQAGLALNRYKSRMFRSVIRLLQRYGANGGTLLDVGTSYGGFPLMARDHGFQVHGMDIVPEAIQYVREQGIPCDNAASVADLSIPDGSLDVISALDCICYWPDHRKELQSIRQKLSSHGLLVIRTPTKRWMFRMGMIVGGILPRLGSQLCVRAITEHRAAIAVPTYLQILQREGFEVLYASPVGAQHSDHSSWLVKMNFALGALVWRMTGIHVAPGSLILCRNTRG